VRRLQVLARGTILQFIFAIIQSIIKFLFFLCSLNALFIKKVTESEELPAQGSNVAANPGARSGGKEELAKPY
jgi:hypothetical protein